MESSLRDQLRASQREVERLRAELSELKDPRKSGDPGNADFPDLRIRLESLKDQNKSLLLQIDSLTMEKASLQGELAFVKSKARSPVDASTFNRQIAILQSQLSLAERENSELRNSIASNEEMHTGEISARDVIIRKLKKKLDNRSREKEESDLAQAEKDAELAKMKNQESNSRARCEKAEKRCSELSNRYKSLYSKYKSLKGKYSDTLHEAEEMPKVGNRRKQMDDEICNLTVQRQQFEGLLRISEQKYAQEKEVSQELQRKLEHAEAELTELRCFLKILATNERRVKKLGAERDGIIDELQNLGGKIDRFGRSLSPQRTFPPRRSPQRKRPIQSWRSQ
jgi:chromosome segregation ATPase